MDEHAPEGGQPVPPAPNSQQPTAAPPPAPSGPPPSAGATPPVAAQPLPPLVPPPPPPPPVAPPPYGPPAGQAFAALGAQGRAVLSRLDPGGTRPAAIVALILLALVFGSLVINAAIPARAAVGPGPGPGPQPPPGGSVEFAGGVHVYPQSGWVYSTPAQNQLRLEKGAAVLDVFVHAPVQGDAAAVLDWYVDNVLRPSASQLAVSQVQVVPASGGATGFRLTYNGNFLNVQQPLEGQLTAVILGGRSLIFHAWGVQGQLAPALVDIGRMIDTTEVR